MNCTTCEHHSCRKLGDCDDRLFDRGDVIASYQDLYSQKAIQAAAFLIEKERRGTLNRLDEIIEYSLKMEFTHIGIAYCWSAEKDVTQIVKIVQERGLIVSAVSCTTGGLSKSQTDNTSTVARIACNPFGQAQQLNAEKVDIVVAIGLCLGHDMLLHKQLQAPCTTLLVKDRTHGQKPLLG